MYVYFIYLFILFFIYIFFLQQFKLKCIFKNNNNKNIKFDVAYDQVW